MHSLCTYNVHTSAILQSSPSLYITLDQLSNYVTYVHMPAIHRLEELLVLWFNTKGYERAVHKVSPISPPRHSLTSSLLAIITKQLHRNSITWVPVWHPMWSKILSSLVICLVISMLLTTLFFIYPVFMAEWLLSMVPHDSTLWTHKVDTLLLCSIVCQWIWWSEVVPCVSVDMITWGSIVCQWIWWCEVVSSASGCDDVR